MPTDIRRRFKYNLVCRLFFGWADPLFCIGCRRSLRHSDLYTHPPECDSQYLHDKFMRYWSEELSTRQQNARLWWVLVKCFWWRMLLFQILTLVMIAIFIIQSEVLGLLTEYFSQESPTSRETNTAYLFAVLLSVLGFLLVFVNMVFFVKRKLGGLIRIVLISAVYSKVVRVSQVTLSELTMGHVINLASNDVQQFEDAESYFSFFLAFPIHLLVVTSLLYREIQWSAILTSGLLIVSIPMILTASVSYSKMKFKAAQVTDKRVKVMNEVISGIRVIKMYGWEYAFSQVVSRIRRSEIWLVLKSAIIKNLSYNLTIRGVTVVMCIVFSVYTGLAGGQLTPRIVFSTLSHITFVRYTLAHFVNGTLAAFDIRVAYKRIKSFLLLPELFQDSLDSNRSETHSGIAFPTPSDTVECKDTGITVEGLTASWSMDINRPTLHDISFAVNQSASLLAVVGPVGSGKSTLLQCLLKELPLLNGTLSVKGSVGFASQEPCVFPTTLRDNILFGLAYNDSWYKSVIEACALEKDIEILADGDMTIVGERGVTLSGGQKARVGLARAVYRRADIYLLDDPLSAVDSAVSRHIFERCICGLLADKCVVLVTHQVQYLNQCDSILRLMQGKVISETIANADVLANGEQIIDKALGNDISSKNELFVKELETYEEVNSDEASGNERSTFIALSDEDRAHGTVSMSTYYQYFKAGGGYFLTLVSLGLLVLSEVNVILTDWWIADWSQCSVQTDLNESTCFLSTNERIQVFSGLAVSLIILTCLESVLVSILLVRASQILHNRMFSRVLRAPMYFFDTNPIGRILNRFSKDIGFMDDLLVIRFFVFFSLMGRCSGAFLTAVIANYYLVILLLILCGMFFSVRWYYIKTARDIKRLEAIARSPIYSHLSLTLQELATIRSYSMQSVMIEQMYHFQNEHTQAWYLFTATSRWFSMRIDSLAVIFVMVTLLSAVALAQELDATLVSLSLAYVITLSDIFSFALRMSSDVENLMVSPERVIAYSKLESEASLETVPPSSQPPSEWPDKGHIVLTDISYRHSSQAPIVLKDVSCTILPGEKVGIVGRTGAGKSSLVAALFRLAEPDGSVKIDGIEVCRLGLHDLRKSMSIIPQDPVLFGGSVRYNLDPFSNYSDEEIWTALEQVQLKRAVEFLDGKLEALISEGGSNFSVGERQLFCLARALLRKKSILVLDEATANVDLETDAIIQKVIREQFLKCTVLTVAHRLNTVMDYDKIMVLEKGQLVEYDNPHLLLCRPGSYLGQLVNQTGPVTASKLRAIAETVYNSQNEE